MHTSRKHQANSLYEGDFSLCDYTLTRHAKQRCKQRHIKPTKARDACAIVKGKFVVTAWQKQLSGVHCSKGIEHLRKTNTKKVIPKEVLVYMRDKGPRVHKGRGKGHKSYRNAVYMPYSPR